MILRAAARTDVGQRRPANEDCYALVLDLGLFLVADGMGGHRAGQVASRLAAEAAERAVREPDAPAASLAERLRDAVLTANREVHETARRKPELSGMGTTLVAFLAREGRAALAHVGDSRAYRLRAGGIRQLTDDHSLVGELVRRREISAEAARAHPHRHVLTRALGVRASVQPDLAELTLEAGDVFVLCSDGLSGCVREEEIAAAFSGGDALETGLEKLVALANERGGEDNITVLAVRCEEESD